MFTSSKKYCINCGNYGHKYNRCFEPIISIGNICFKINFNNLNKDFNILLNNEKIMKYINNLNKIDILKFNSIHINLINNLFKFKKYIKFLIISRKHSLGYIEFIKGNYKIENRNTIIKLFKQMQLYEIEKIKNNSYNLLLKDLWNIDYKKHDNNDNHYNYNKIKREDAEKKFLILKNNNFFSILDDTSPEYSIPEYGFPKGRRNSNENNINCAIREFNEETNLDINNYTIFKNVLPLIETLKGTNNIYYKHIYYISIINNNNHQVYINKNNNSQFNEIGSISWFNYDEVIYLLRSYHKDKIKIINNLFIFISIIILLNK